MLTRSPPADLRSCREGSSLPSRAAFTLIEMLVAISILVILTTLSVGAFTGLNNDRATLSANTLKGAIEGARARAIRSKAVRGLRLITDPNDPRIVTSLAYVGAPDYDTGTCDIVCAGSTWTVTGDTGAWPSLAIEGLLSSGNRIQIPEGQGQWYTIRAVAGNVLTLAGHYQPSSLVSGVFEAVPKDNVTYRLELSPALLSEDPIQLTAQTCIDMDGSQLPADWRIIEDLNRDGVLDLTPPPPVEVDLGMVGRFEYSIRYADRMEILFNPQGRLTGDVLKKGILHFHVCYISDAILAHSNGLRSKATSDTFDIVGVYPSYANYIVQALPEKDHKAVSLFTRTGAVLISEIFATTVEQNAPTNTTTAANPFKYATRGKDSQ